MYPLSTRKSHTTHRPGSRLVRAIQAKIRARSHGYRRTTLQLTRKSVHPDHDRPFSRWPDGIPIDNIEATTIAQHFFTHWIARFGTLLRITSDQGRQFESKLFSRLREITGSERLRTTAYHPQANGLVERFHRHLKAALKCHNTEEWTTTAAEMVYDETIRIPGEFFADNPPSRQLEAADYVTQLRHQMQALRPTPTATHGKNTSFTFRDLKCATPYRIVARKGRNFVIDKHGTHVTVAAERIKPAHLEPSLTPEQAPRILWRHISFQKIHKSTPGQDVVYDSVWFQA